MKVLNSNELNQVSGGIFGVGEKATDATANAVATAANEAAGTVTTSAADAGTTEVTKSIASRLAGYTSAISNNWTTIAIGATCLAVGAAGMYAYEHYYKKA